MGGNGNGRGEKGGIGRGRGGTRGWRRYNNVATKYHKDNEPSDPISPVLGWETTTQLLEYYGVT